MSGEWWQEAETQKENKTWSLEASHHCDRVYPSSFHVKKLPKNSDMTDIKVHSSTTILHKFEWKSDNLAVFVKLYLRSVIKKATPLT